MDGKDTSKNYGGAERRQFKRLPVSFTVFYQISLPIEVRIKFGDQEVVALAADISEGGMAVTTYCEIPPVAIISVKFVIFNDKFPLVDKKSRTVTTQAEVRYNRAVEPNKEYRMGIQFLHMSDDDRRFIRSFISANK
jgi:c-di-GMP-binding flagellar brake protein YcgR